MNLWNAKAKETVHEGQNISSTKELNGSADKQLLAEGNSETYLPVLYVEVARWLLPPRVHAKQHLNLFGNDYLFDNKCCAYDYLFDNNCYAYQWNKSGSI